jgi:hypothetical protein
VARIADLQTEDQTLTRRIAQRQEDERQLLATMSVPVGAWKRRRTSNRS